MVLIPACLLAAFQPGFLFPQMAERMATRSAGKGRVWKLGGKKTRTPEASTTNGDGSAGEESKEKTAGPEVVKEEP